MEAAKQAEIRDRRRRRGAILLFLRDAHPCPTWMQVFDACRMEHDEVPSETFAHIQYLVGKGLLKNNRFEDGESELALTKAGEKALAPKEEAK